MNDMMKEILITSSALILALLILRRVFRKVLSRRFQYALWGLVLLRLLVPVSLLPAADFSVLTATASVQQAVAERVNLDRIFYSQPQGQVSREELEERNIDPQDIPTAQDLFVLGESDPDNRFSTNWLVRDPESGSVTRYAEMTVGPWDFLDAVWKTGMVLMGAFFLLSNLGFYWRLRKKRRPYATLFEGGTKRVYLVPQGVIPSPCLFGRSIYITPAVAEDSARLRHVLAHESTHARHWDPVWSLLRCLCLTVYWFDPLVWIAARCSKTDCELACDESVLEALGEAERIPYGQTLLSLIPVKRVSNPMIAATTMTAGKKQLKDRVKRIAQKPRQLMAAAIAVAVLAGVVSACTFTGGTSGESVTPEPSPSQGPTESTVRSLTGEELRWFNEEFFNHNPNPAISYTYTIRNQFANPGIRYDKPEDIDLYELLYLEGKDVPDNELSIVWAGDDPDSLPCPAYKLTTAEIDAILTQYTGLTLEQANKASLTYEYSAEHDAYYWMHGDTNYCGDLNFTAGTRAGDTVKLYHTSDFAGTDWYCVTLTDRGDGQYWFVSNQTCERPVIPTPLPAWEPESTVSLQDLTPYTAPAATVEPHVGDFDGGRLIENWNLGGHNVVVYRANDGKVYAALRQEDDTMNVFLTLPTDDCSLFFYNDLLGHSGFYIKYVGSTPGDYYKGGEGSAYGTIYEYFYIDEGGVPVRLLRNPSSGSAQIDLNGDGQDELLGSGGFFFQRDGQIYLAALTQQDGLWPGQIENMFLDPYGKYFTVRGYTEDYKEWTRCLYFDGENLLIYKNEKPTTDHMVDGADDGVPAPVVAQAKKFVSGLKWDEKDGTFANANYHHSSEARYDDWRVDYFTGPYTYSYGGATVEGWWFNYELHTTTPENIVLAGGRYLTEDDWVSPGYPGCDALFFEVKDGSYRLLDSRMAQESPESYYINEQVLGMMEEKGVELTDGSTYAGLLFQMRLGHVTGTYYDYANPDGVEMQVQYDDGQGYGGSHIVHPHEGNGPYYLGQMKDNYVVWSRAQAPAAPPAGATVILSDPYWYDMLQFWQNSGLVMYKEQNQEPEWYEVRYNGNPAEDVFSYRAVPYYWARCWFDDAEHEALEAELPLIPDEGQDHLSIAREWAQAYEGLMTRLSPGGSITCTYVKVTGVEIWENQPETWFPADIVDYPHFCFSYRVVFVPENEDALNTLMAGNTGEYEGNDPDVPQGALEYSRMGAMYRKDGYWYCSGVGTG